MVELPGAALTVIGIRGNSSVSLRATFIDYGIGRALAGARAASERPPTAKCGKASWLRRSATMARYWIEFASNSVSVVQVDPLLEVVMCASRPASVR